MATSARPASLKSGSLDSWEYLASYEDLMNAFGPDSAKAAAHYTTFGYAEGRTITFDAWNYLASCEDLMNAFGPDAAAAATHYIIFGRHEERTITFDAWEYLASCEDLMNAFGPDAAAAATHYIIFGRHEERTITFDAAAYLASYEDLQAAFGTDTDLAAEHYVRFGRFEGRIIVSDTTPPLFASAEVNGSSLVMTYTDDHDLDAGNPPLAGAFTVSGSHAVTAVAVDADAKTVTLTLGTPVANGEAVTVTYSDPTAGNDASAIQDVAGNDAASLSSVTVQNNTPAPGDTTPPLFASAEVNGSALVMTYTDQSNLDDLSLPDPASYTVSGHTVTGVAIDGDTKTVTLTLDTPAEPGETVTVSYNAGAAGSPLQDTAGNDAASFTAATVQNSTADTEGPVLLSATVEGVTMVLTFSDQSNLDTINRADPGTFTVSGGHTVVAQGVDATAKTVTLQLATPVANGEAVTISYTDPTAGNDASAIQDVAGNDAASFSGIAVQNNTPDTTAPIFSSASVSGTTLVMAYTELHNLDNSNLPAMESFRVHGSTSGLNAVTAVAINAGAKTVTLSLDHAILNGETVTLDYNDPGINDDANAIQDDSGNDAASLNNAPVQNNTPGADTDAPQLSRASASGNTITLVFDDQSALDGEHIPDPDKFSVSGSIAGDNIVVTGVAVDSAAKTVTLTLDTDIVNGESVSVQYSDPTPDDDTDAIQDIYGHDATSFGPIFIDNETPDTTAPVFTSATVSSSTLVMTYTDLNSLDAAVSHLPATSGFDVTGNISGDHTVTNVTINPSANTVTLTLSAPVLAGETVTVSYTDPAGDTVKAIQDESGNDATSLVDGPVSNNTPADSAAPVLASVTVNGTALVLAYTDASYLDAANIPATGRFTVSGHAVSGVAVDADAKTLTLTLATAVEHAENITLSYDAAGSGNPIQDMFGNDAGAISSMAVQNNTPDTDAPEFNSATVNGTTLVLTYTDTSDLDALTIPAPGDFAVSGHTVTDVDVDADAKTVTLTLAESAGYLESVTVSYTPGGNPLQDASGNDAAGLTNETVTNETTDFTAPELVSAEVNGSTLVLTFTDESELDAAHPPLSGAFTLTGNESGTIAVTGVAVDGAAKTVTLTLAAEVHHQETVSVSYTDPAGDATNAIQDTEGNDAASLSGQAVTNSTGDNRGPVFDSAEVDGDSLTLHFTDFSSLGETNLPAPGAFTVSGHTVTDVDVDADAKTVTLTLGSPVGYLDDVTVGYTDPTSGNDANAIQDALGNDAASFSGQAVTNNTLDTTPPLFQSAVINTDGITLVMTYNDQSDLDDTHLPAAGAFTVTGASSGAHLVSSIAVNAAAGTVTLTLQTPAASGETVTLSYTDPAGDTASTIQDTEGNDADSLASVSVTNNTNAGADTTAPTVWGFTPEDNANNADLFVNPVMHFSETVTAVSGKYIKLYQTTGNILIGTLSTTQDSSHITISGTGSSCTVELDFDTDLTAGSEYYIEVENGAFEDLAGNDFAGISSTTEWSFTGVMTGGTAGDDTINGTTSNDLINGYGGNDLIHGLQGNDTIDGGTGNDTMYGNDGDDIFSVDSTSDVVTENNGEGTDTIHSTVTYTLPSNVENLELKGSANIDGTGNEQDNELIGNTGNNTLSGGEGLDAIDGGLGADTLSGGNGSDMFIFDSVSASGETITDFSHSEDQIVLNSLDANTMLDGVQAFSFIDSGAFTNNAGELRFDSVHHQLQGDTNGDGTADFAITLTGVTTLDASDLILS